MYSLKEIVTVAQRKQVHYRQKRAGLILVFAGSSLIWVAIITLVLQIS